MKLGTKLISAFGAIAILIALSGYIGSTEIDNLYSAYYKEQNEIIPALTSIAEMKATLPIIELEPSEYVNEPDKEHIEELDEAQEDMEASLATYQRAMGEQTFRVDSEIDSMFSMSKEIVSLRDSRTDKPTLDAKFEQLDDSLDQFNGRLENENQRITEQLSLSRQGLERDIGFAYQLTVFLAAGAAIIAILVGLYMTLAISKPISRLSHAADQIGKGFFDVDTDVSKSTDEIGMLSSHFCKMKDQLQHKEKMQNEFISIASHELKTPIQPIMSYAELAQKGIVEPRAALEVIGSEAKRLQHLANDILDVSRIESGRIKYNKEKVDLTGLVSDIVHNHQVVLAHASKSNLEVRLISPKNGLRLSVYGDRIRIAQVLNNLVGNALKFTQKGSVDVLLDYVDDDERKEIQIKISDTGAGIPPEVLPRIFGKFVTQGNTTINNQQGTGLGLYIARAIVEAHEGEISASNNGDRPGATFKITLPLHTAESPEDQLRGRAEA